MLFNSLEFLLFFPVVTALNFLAPHRWRWLVLLVASCVFYAAFIPKYLLILAFLILVDYIAGRGIEGAAEPRRRALLLMSLVANLALLGFFKYANFVDSNLNSLLAAGGLAWVIPHLDIILPIGLSFHTFQAMSYTIEVYRGTQPAERHLGIYALYVMFFPQLVAGPIERPQQLLHQLRERHDFDLDRAADGLKLMLWGFFKKVVIADRLGLYVNQIYYDPTRHTGWPLIVATYFFAFQIYCDFSGYTDIAIGAAQVLGIRLMDNFNRPYFAKSIVEFWRRWHISLSSWFRDYVYIPLGGNRVPLPRWYLNILIVFLLSGLWHGANWTFLAWGALHGCYVLGGSLTAPWRRRVYASPFMQRVQWSHRWIRALVTFHLVLVAWVFFRASSISEAGYVLSHALVGLDMASFRAIAGTEYFMVSVLLIAVMEGVHVLERHGAMRKLLDEKPLAVRWSFYYALLFLIVSFGMFHSPMEFIYFQF
jgi:D-alanyl-lipoteichoic acid acyltransferase DltB (MBOAT superfamily)